MLNVTIKIEAPQGEGKTKIAEALAEFLADRGVASATYEEMTAVVTEATESIGPQVGSATIALLTPDDTGGGLTADDQQLLLDRERSFGIYDPHTPGVVYDAEMVEMARCEDPRVASLIARLLEAFFEEHENRAWRQELT